MIKQWIHINLLFTWYKFDKNDINVAIRTLFQNLGLLKYGFQDTLWTLFNISYMYNMALNLLYKHTAKRRDVKLNPDLMQYTAILSSLIHP